MMSLDLKDAYLQVPMHLESRKFLRFLAFGKVYQFKVLCFGLSTAPQAFTQVMAPVSSFLHRSGIRLHRYLDDWLIQVSSQEQVLLALDTVLQLCQALGIVVNWEKSQLVPTQRMVYQGVLLDSLTFRASPAKKRVEKLLSIGDVFLSCVEQPVSSWLELSGVLSSMTRLVPGGRLRMRSLQLVLRCSWDSSGSGVVAGLLSTGGRDISHSGVPPARHVVRRLGRGLGGSSRRGSCFRSLVSRGSGVAHKCQRALGRRLWSSVLLLRRLRTPQWPCSRTIPQR